ncbi:Predicted permeases [Actinomyces bovis]|uniref:Predicted permeases n=1 Tax=Actinomyces bovis TaxID=1658 RepID=A0ABY1VQ60_9ACTO|nr:DMT family transporter [Actinomyces bovis]SPT54270.1 Predicted permeases [Actinomyces bovis]VEG56414.1 Predicted permeases [Actinomyces israelii]
MSTTSAAETTTSGNYVMNKSLGALAMVLSATGMGLVGTLSRGATKGLIPNDKSVIGSFLAFGRMGMGLVGFVILLLLTRKVALFKTTKLSFPIIMGGVSIGLSLGCYISSTLLTSIANAVFLIYTGPLFCTILARIFRKEKISPLNGFFLFLVFLGMLFTIGVIDYKDGSLVFGLNLEVTSAEFPKKPLGDFLGLLSGVLYGLALFFNGYRKDVDSVVRGTWNFLWAAIATICMSLLLKPWHGVATFTAGNWAWAFSLFFFCGLFAIGWLVVAGRNLPAVEMSTISYWECPVAIICGFLIFHENLTPIGALGGLLIIGGGFAPIIVDAVNRRRGVTTVSEATASPAS